MLIGWAGIALAHTDPVPVATESAMAAPVAGPPSPDRQGGQGVGRAYDDRVGNASAPIQRPLPHSSPPEPTNIRIPEMGVDQGLVELAVIGSSLQVPDDYSDIGWWSGGRAPGEASAAVVVGHVDSLTGPAVFYELSALERGDRVRVRREDGSRLVFAVRRTAVYDRDDFPAERVYRSGGRPSVHLLTCGGSFDAETGHYSDNVVVFTELVERLRAGASTRTSDSGTDGATQGRADR